MLKEIYLLPMTVLNKVILRMHKAEIEDNIVINGRLRLFGNGKLQLGEGVRINSLYRMNPIGGNEFCSIYIKPNALVKIGKNTGISNAALYASKCIEIGERVKIGGNVKIYDTDFHSLNYKERAMANDPGVKSESVYIRDDAFIGAHSIILKGVTVGERSVIAAGSVVTKSVPHDEMWGGVPARFIKKLGGNEC